VLQSPERRILFLSFGALFLELMLIRWVPSVVLMAAYYANLLLVSSFLGLGLGALLSRRQLKLFRWFPVLLQVYVGMLLLSRATPMPSSAGEVRFYAATSTWIEYARLIAAFVLNTAVFAPFGERLADLFRRLPPLRAYGWDLAGSLCGTVAFGLFSFYRFSPVIGIAVVGVVYLGLSERRSWAWTIPVLATAVIGAGISAEAGALWSPYHHVLVRHLSGAPLDGDPPADLRTMRDPPVYVALVNQHFYQVHGTMDLARYTPTSPFAPLVVNYAQRLGVIYEAAARHDRVLVLGAGGGVDVEAALRAGARSVDAVEIDPALVALSRRLNASGVYDDPRVHVHIGDARAFLERAQPGYDVVVFGHLDSQALFSYGTNLRLDGYTYTVESLRRAYALTAPDGTLAVSFTSPGPWLATRLEAMMAAAIGHPPAVFRASTSEVLLGTRGAWHPPVGAEPWPASGATASGDIALATDDWPYLYLTARRIPPEYLLVIGTLLLLSTAAVLWLRGGALGGANSHFFVFFFLGLAFLLLEAKSIGDCSLYFGATWIVTTLVVSGVLIMVLLGNLLAARVPRFSFWIYLPLLASVAALALIPRSLVLGLPTGGRALFALAVCPLPVLFASLIFSTLFRTTADAPSALGANLIGATVGGFTEYLSMATGTRPLWVIIAAAYLASMVFAWRQGSARNGATPS
jgi:hypothetical protein